MIPIRNLAAATAILVYALIVLGAVVRTTDSGLSCPDWPTCYGHWVPLPGDIAAVPNIGYSYGQVMLEWVHRLVAGVLVGPLVLLLAVLTFRIRRERRELASAGGALLVLLLLQAALGGLTVLDLNSAWSVAIHLGNALLALDHVPQCLEHRRQIGLELLDGLAEPVVRVRGQRLSQPVAAPVAGRAGDRLLEQGAGQFEGLTGGEHHAPRLEIHGAHARVR